MVDEEITQDKTEKARKPKRPGKARSPEKTSLESTHDPKESVQDLVKPEILVESEQKAAVLDTEQAGPRIMAMAGPDRLREMLEELRAKDKITSDDGAEIDFDLDTKEYFIGACERAYPIIQQTLNSMHQIGAFLHKVRTELKPKKLYYTWLEFIGIPNRTAHNYVRTYEKFQDRLPEYSYLGLKKLLITSRLPDCREYVDKNLQRIAKESSAELEKEVKALLAKDRATGKGRGRKPSRMDVGKYVLRPSMDGTRLTIEGLSEKKREQLIEAIKALLLQENE